MNNPYRPYNSKQPFSSRNSSQWSPGQVTLGWPISNEARQLALRQKSLSSHKNIFYYLYIKIPLGKPITDDLDSVHNATQPCISLTEFFGIPTTQPLLLFFNQAQSISKWALRH